MPKLKKIRVFLAEESDPNNSLLILVQQLRTQVEPGAQKIHKADICTGVKTWYVQHMYVVICIYIYIIYIYIYQK